MVRCRSKSSPLALALQVASREAGSGLMFVRCGRVRIGSLVVMSRGAVVAFDEVEVVVGNPRRAASAAVEVGIQEAVVEDTALDVVAVELVVGGRVLEVAGSSSLRVVVHRRNSCAAAVAVSEMTGMQLGVANMAAEVARHTHPFVVRCRSNSSPYRPRLEVQVLSVCSGTYYSSATPRRICLMSTH